MVINKATSNIKPDYEIHTDIHVICIHIVIINEVEEDFYTYVTDKHVICKKSQLSCSVVLFAATEEE